MLKEGVRGEMDGGRVRWVEGGEGRVGECVKREDVIVMSNGKVGASKACAKQQSLMGSCDHHVTIGLSPTS